MAPTSMCSQATGARRDTWVMVGPDASRHMAQYLGVYVRNQNPRLQTLELASDLRLDLQGGCEEPISSQLTKLAEDAHLMSGGVHTYYFTLAVTGGRRAPGPEVSGYQPC